MTENSNLPPVQFINGSDTPEGEPNTPAEPLAASVAPFPTHKVTPGVPGWCPVPSGFVVPRGKRPVFMRFRAAWTDDPTLGDRTCVLWSLSVNDERLANKRALAQGQETALGELSKQMVRVIDGMFVDWSGANSAADLDRFWDKIGAKCRQLVMNTYLKTHNLDEAERADFFGNCIEVMEGVA